MPDPIGPSPPRGGPDIVDCVIVFGLVAAVTPLALALASCQMDVVLSNVTDPI
jgi:hypothetical protein